MYFHPCTWNSVGNLSFFVKTHQAFRSHEQISLTTDLLGCPGSPKWLCPPREKQILKRRIPNNQRDWWCVQESHSFHCLPEESCFPAVRTRQKFCWNIHWSQLVKRHKRIIILRRNFFLSFFQMWTLWFCLPQGGQLVPSLLPFHLDFRAWVASKVEPLIKAT